MKSKNFIPTLLALVIRMMLSGQTTGSSHRTLPVLGDKTQSSPNGAVAKKQIIREKTETLQKDASSNPSQGRKVYPELISSSDTKITSAGKTDNNTFNYYTNSSCYSTEIYANELLKQAEELMLVEKTLREQAAKSESEEKTKLIASANGLLLQAQLKQIQASEIKGKISREQFAKLQKTFLEILFKASDDLYLFEAKALNAQAGKLMKNAGEMREEAYSQTSLAAKLGTMNNAEEKEAIALVKQEESISLAKRAIAANFTELLSDLVCR